MNTYEITYSSSESGEPVLSKVILETKVPVNILKADIGQERGVMVINIIGGAGDVQRVLKAFRRYEVRTREIKRKITVDRDRCIDCGGCVGLCPVGALELDRTRTLKLKEEKCIQCRACVIACPVSALSIEE